jgi:hypothetical protein
MVQPTSPQTAFGTAVAGGFFLTLKAELSKIFDYFSNMNDAL